MFILHQSSATLKLGEKMRSGFCEIQVISAVIDLFNRNVTH